MRSVRALAVALALLVLAAPRARAQEHEAPDDGLHVVLISLDGLRPEFYLSDDFDTPVLHDLVAHGACARAVQPAFPSCTYPGHASIVTGVWADKHGIVANTQWSEQGAKPEWLWETTWLKAKPIWQAAHEQGRKVAITQWPTTVGADVDWLVPERWGVHGESTRDLLLKLSTPGFLVELAIALGIPDLGANQTDDRSKIDEFVSGSAAHVLVAHRPALVLAHLVQVDEVEHAHGRDGAAVKAAVHRVDACVGKIRDAAKAAGMLDRTAFVICGDHGFTDVTTTVSPNVFLARAGLVDVDAKGDVTGWRALGHSHGGSMGIHARDEASARAARTALESAAVVDGKRLYRIVDKAEAARFGGDPEVAFWLDAGHEVGFWGQASGPPTVDHLRRGTHGGLPDKPELQTGFIGCGPGFRHTVVDHMRLIDEAPTLAKLLHIDLPNADGGVVPVLEEEPD